MVYIQHMNNTAAATTTQTADFAKGVAAGAASFVAERDENGHGVFPMEFAGNEAFGEGFNAGWDAVAEQAGR